MTDQPPTEKELVRIEAAAKGALHNEDGEWDDHIATADPQTVIMLIREARAAAKMREALRTCRKWSRDHTLELRPTDDQDCCPKCVARAALKEDTDES